MNPKIKILLAEDNINDVKLLEKEFRKEKLVYDLLVADNESDFREKIENHKFDLILSDYSMPDFDGMTALQIRNEVSPLIPFIIVTGSINEDTAVKCIKAGADDYVIKEHIGRISSSIKSALEKYELNLEKEKAQNALIESEKKYRNLVDNLSVGIYQISPDGAVLQVNPAFRKLIGLKENENNKFSPESLKKFSAWDFYPDNSVREEVLNTIIQKGEINNKEIQIYDLNKNLIWVSISSKARYDEKGNLLWIDGVMEDISQRKMSEAELIEAKEQAEAANRLKSNFLANMSHELRTPMVAILGFSDLLQEEIENKEQRQMAEMISRGGRRLKNTLDLILDLSRIESGGLITDVSPQDVTPIINSVYGFYKIIAEKKNLKFEVETGGNLVADINASMLEKVLANLVENAVTYTKKGNVKITAGTKKSEEGHLVFVKVADSGIGIDENMYDLIFEPFRQVSEGYSREYEGTGLGLSITKKYVELMKGTIEVESKPGKGSTFTVYLPGCADVSQAKKSNYANNQQPAGIFNGIKTGKRILLVEDDESNAIMISRILQNVCEYDAVDSGEDAILKCENIKYSLILMDIGLRGISGIEAAKKIKSLPECKNVPIVALTAFAMVGDRERILKEGCDDYISKPFEIKRFVTLIKKYLNS